MKRMMALALALTCGAAAAAPVMYVHDSAGKLGTVDVATGSVELIGSMGVVMTDIAFDPDGDLFGLSFTGLYSINAASGAATFIGNHGIAGGNALVFGAGGTLYAAGSSTGLYSLNTLTGAGTLLGGMGFASAGDLAFNGGNLYLAATTNQLVQVDLSVPASSFAVGSFGVAGVFGLATGDNDVLYAVAGTTIYEVDTTTGAASNGVSFGLQGLGEAYGESFYTEAGAPPPTSVPEPSTLPLLGIGVLAAATAIRRRRITGA